MMMCRTCQYRCEGRYCCAACETTGRQIAEAHEYERAVLRREAHVRAGTHEDERWAGRAAGANRKVNPDPPQPAVLYGLLTAADVAELGLRRARFEAAGRRFRTTESDLAEAG